MTPSVPPTTDRRLLGIYLTDHLAGATGAVQRLEQMRSAYTDLPVHGEIADLAGRVAGERDRLAELIHELGLSPRRGELVLARAGEALGRLKLNGRVLSRSPLTPLLEVELLRSGVVGKLSLWQTLQVHGAELGLDAQELVGLHQRALDQLEVIERIHAVLARDAFTAG